MVKRRSWIWTRKAIFGFWLPFIGWRIRYMGVQEAWDFDQTGAGVYEFLEAQWLGFGLHLAYRPIIKQ